jgi:G protein beta subunit-like protein
MPAQPNNDQSGVILVTAGYDHTIKFWEALSGICSRTIQHPDSVVPRATD